MRRSATQTLLEVSIGATLTGGDWGQEFCYLLTPALFEERGDPCVTRLRIADDESRAGA